MKAKQVATLKKIPEIEKDPKKIDFTKEYKNGHKFLNASESEAYRLLLLL